MRGQLGPVVAAQVDGRATLRGHALEDGHDLVGRDAATAGWRNGAFKRIDPAPLLVLSTVADVSETGVLVGETVTPDTKIHGYIARPTS